MRYIYSAIGWTFFNGVSICAGSLSGVSDKLETGSQVDAFMNSVAIRIGENAIQQGLQQPAVSFTVFAPFNGQ